MSDIGLPDTTAPASSPGWNRSLKIAKIVYCIALGALTIWAFVSSTGHEVKNWRNWSDIEDADGFRTMVVIFFTLFVAVLLKDGRSLIRDLAIGTVAFLAVIFEDLLVLVAPDWAEIYLTVVLLGTVGAIAWNNRTRRTHSLTATNSESATPAETAARAGV